MPLCPAFTNYSENSPVMGYESRFSNSRVTSSNASCESLLMTSSTLASILAGWETFVLALSLFLTNIEFLGQPASTNFNSASTPLPVRRG